MAWFKSDKTPAITKAQAGASSYGRSQIGNFSSYNQGSSRARAMSVPTISRARDLVCATIGELRLEMIREMWNGEELERVPLAPRSWLSRIDKGVPNSFILSWTADDLLFYGRAFWWITERTADGYPASFTRLPAHMVTTEDQAPPVWFGPSHKIEFNGSMLDHRNVVQFLSPVQGLIYTASKPIETALKLEQARFRNAASSIPAVVLKQTGGEPLSGQELAELASAFDVARLNNQTAAVNEYIDVKETFATPDKMLMIDAAEYQALDLARAAGVPPYLLGIATGSYAYTNSQAARQDLYVFGMAPIMRCIEETLSSDNVLPHGTGVKFDVEDWISEVYGNQLTELAPGQMPPVQQPAGEENTQDDLA